MSRFIEDIVPIWLYTNNQTDKTFYNFFTYFPNGANVTATISISGFGPGYKPNAALGSSVCWIEAFEYVDENGINQIVKRNGIGNNAEHIENCKSITFLLHTVLGESVAQASVFIFGDLENKAFKKTMKGIFHLMVIFDKKTGKISSMNQILISKNTETHENHDDLLKRTIEQYTTDIPKNMSFLFFENTQLEQNKNYKIDIKTKKIIEYSNPSINKSRFRI